VATWYLEKDGIEFDVEAKDIEEAKSKVNAYFKEREPKKETKKADMSTLDKAAAVATTFTEGSIGGGDELGAIGSMLGGSVYDLFNTDKDLSKVFTDNFKWDQQIERQQKGIDRLSDEHPVLSEVANAAGMVTGLAIPAATLSKGNAAAKVVTAAAEGAVYGGLSSRGEDRAEGLMTGAVIGGALGGAGVLATKWLTKSKDEIARIDAEEAARADKAAEDDSYIWGEEGLGDVSAPLVQQGPSVKKIDASIMKKSRKFLKDTEDKERVTTPSGLWAKTKDLWNYGTRGTAERVQDLTGNKRAGMLIKDVEILTEQSSSAIDDAFEELAPLAGSLTARMQQDILNIGAKNGDSRVTYESVLEGAKSPEEAKAFQEYFDVLKEVRKADLPGWSSKKKDYAPSLTKGGDAGDDKLGVNDYENPLIALKDLAKDVQQARILARRFGVTEGELAKLKPKGRQSRLDSVIDLIEQKASLQAGRTTKKGVRKGTDQSKKAAAVLADGLRSTLINSKKGGEAVGSIARKFASTGLLANWGNAALNVVEGATLPIYQNGFKAWAATVPKMLAATFNKGKSEADPQWLSTKEFGQDKQFMGEVAAEAEGKVAKMVDNVGAFTYKWTGVQRVNDMGAEGLANTALTFARDMAKKGDEKSLSRLRNHVAAEGMSTKEFNTLVKDLRSGGRSAPVDTFAGRAMLALQPRGASSMPQFYNDVPNGRVAYSMLSYMNRMYNVIRNDIGDNLADAQKYGINTERGRKALKEASVNGVSFAALMGLVNGVWNDGRLALFDGEKREALMKGEIRGKDLGTSDEFLGWMLESTTNQMGSLASSGLVNTRAEEYGGSKLDFAPPPLKMVGQFGEGLFDVVTEQDPTQLLRFGQSYVPGVSQLDKGRRAVTGDRLFQEIAYDN